MKIYVNKMPTKPKECLFARKKYGEGHRIVDVHTGEITRDYSYTCCVNMKQCNIDCGGKCNKLRVLT